MGKEKKTPSNNTHANRNEDAGSPPIEATGRIFPTQQRSIQGLSTQSRITPTYSASSPSQKSYISQNTKKSTQSNVVKKIRLQIWRPLIRLFRISLFANWCLSRFNLHKVRAFQQARNRGSFGGRK
jgi:hypothetical protein